MDDLQTSVPEGLLGDVVQEEGFRRVADLIAHVGVRDV